MQNSIHAERPDCIASVSRAFDILEYLSYSATPVGISELSKRFQINRATTYHLVNSLIAKGYVYRNADRKYLITCRAFELGVAYQNRFPAVHYMKRCNLSFMSAIPCTCKLAVLTNDLRALIIYSRSTEDALVQLQPGYTFPLHTSASGKVLLAFSQPGVAERYLENRELTGFTLNTITNKEQFLRELELVRSRGYALDDREWSLDQICIAGPVMDRNHNVSALTVSGQAEVVKRHWDRLVHEVLTISRFLSKELGDLVL